MKKLIAIIVALAMVLSMSVMAFAGFAGVKSPADISESRSGFDDAVSNPLMYPQRYNEIRNQGIYTKDDGSLMTYTEAWQAYLGYVLANAASDPITAVTEVVDILSGGYMEPGDLLGALGQAMGGIGGDIDITGVFDDILGAIGGLFDSEAEPQVSAEDYAQELIQMISDGAALEEITAKIGEDIASGKIVISQIPDIVAALTSLIEIGDIEDNETVQDILAFLEGLGGDSDDGGFQFPDFGDFTLPWDNENSILGTILDTILGIFGTIGDLLFGSGDSGNGGSGGGYDWGDDGWGDDGWSDGDNTTVIPDTGDISFVAVAAVAAVAGAALVLTRKKNDDAE